MPNLQSAPSMEATFAADLEERVFEGAAADRFAGLVPVGADRLDPLLRCVLFTDGTVTRALEAQMLTGVRVEVLAQERVRTPAVAAAALACPPSAVAIRRRVAMTAARNGATVARAESYVLPGRLPRDFPATLEASPKGIGESLHRAHLESRRELIAFGLDRGAAWAPGASAETVLVRLYRLVTGGRAAMLIREEFPAQEAAGTYSLAAAPLTAVAAS